MPQKIQEPIRLTIKELVNNPTGKSSAYLANRKMINESLKNQYNTMMALRKNKALEYKIYKENEEYFFHFKIPSRTFPDFYYDTLLQFYPDPEKYDDCVHSRTINDYYVKIFSNSPAFMFTYTYVVYNNDMLVDGMERFCSKEALTTAPTIRNPVETYGYEKSIYFSCLYIITTKLYDKFTIEKMLYVKRKDVFDKHIMTQEKKLIAYNNEKKKIAKEKKIKRLENLRQGLARATTKNEKAAKKAEKKMMTTGTKKQTSRHTSRAKRPSRR